MGELTHKAIDGIRAELAAQVERTNDWRARAAQAELDTSEQRTRAEAAEAELRELRMKHGALATVAKLLVDHSVDEEDLGIGCGGYHCEACHVDRLGELLADEGAEWVEKAHCDTIEGELRDLRRVVDAWKAADEDRANHKESRCGEELLQQLLEEAEEALRHA